MKGLFEGYLIGFGMEPDRERVGHSETPRGVPWQARNETAGLKPFPGVSNRSHIARVRRDTDRIPRPVDFRLAIPAGALWVTLLVANLAGMIDQKASLLIAAVFGTLALGATVLNRLANSGAREDSSHTPQTGRDSRGSPPPGRTLSQITRTGRSSQSSPLPGGPDLAFREFWRSRTARHRLFPGGSAAALVALAAFTVALGFAAHAVNLAITARDPLAVIGSDSAHRFTLNAQVITTPRAIIPRSEAAEPPSRDSASSPSSHVTPSRGAIVPNSGDSYLVELRGESFTWRDITYRTHAKLQVKGKGWDNIPLGATVSLRLGLAGLDPTGEFLGQAKSPGKPQLTAPPSGRYRYVHAVRERLAEATATLPKDIQSMVQAMTLGLTSTQTEADREAMRVSGLAHLTAVSGMHLSVLIGLALGLTIHLPRPIQVGTAAVLAIAFLAMLEGSSSVTRAAAMGAITLFGLALGRPSRSISALSLAVLGMLLVMPWQATSWGFALSVVATLSIVTLGDVLSHWLAVFLPRIIAFPLAVSLAAQLGCQPLMLILRGKLQLYSLPANLLTGAISSVVTVGGLVLIALPATPVLAPLTTVTTQVTGASATWVLRVARFFAGVSGAEVPWVESGYGVVGILLVSGAGLWLTWRFVSVQRWRVGKSREPSPPGHSRGLVRRL